MPKYYCDYCDTFLTHDSPSVRKTHNGGRKHKENVRIYYTKWMEDQAQSLIDQTTAQMKLNNQPPSQVLIHQPVNVMPVMMARAPPAMSMMGGMMRPGQVPLRGPLGPQNRPTMQLGRPPMQMGMRIRGPMPQDDDDES